MPPAPAPTMVMPSAAASAASRPSPPAPVLPGNGGSASRPVPKKSSSAPLWIGLGTVLVLGIAGGGGYWYWSQHASPSAATVSDASPSSASAAASPAVAPASSAASAPASPALASAAQESPASTPNPGSPTVAGIAFERYAAAPYTGPVVMPDFNGTERAYREYRTRLAAGAQSGVNFAGHYAIVTFGCGAECLMGYMVDERNGGVRELGYGGENQTNLGLAYKPNSSLLKVSYWDGTACHSEAVVWDGTHFKTIASQSSPTPEEGGMSCPSVEETPADATTNTAASPVAPTTTAQEPPAPPPQPPAAPPPRVQAAQPQAPQRSGIDDAARQMLTDGQACFDRQDYTCAITNAGNALRIKPGYRAAEALRARAQAAQSQAMNNIDIH
ncbi:MAG: hypothetical protein JSR34_05170 [Proteobacteria bacterium]|nr:hypothetical protein [Pseudomonadota bacterium]